MKFIHSLSWWRKIADCLSRETADQKTNTRENNPPSELRNQKTEGPRLLTFFCGPFRCPIRINSTASEAAQSISKSVDSAGRVSISHGVTQSTWGDLRSSTVQMQWCSVSQLKTLLRKASSSQGRQGRQIYSCCYLQEKVQFQHTWFLLIVSCQHIWDAP